MTYDGVSEVVVVALVVAVVVLVEEVGDKEWLSVLSGAGAGLRAGKALGKACGTRLFADKRRARRS